jgi:hypothetical protein
VKLLTRSNTKTRKGERHGYHTLILHLAPGNLSGYEVCGARDECFDTCLNWSGRGVFQNIQAARIRKTKWFFEDRESFMEQLVADIEEGIRWGKRNRKKIVVRLNGTSDIPWETIRCGSYRNIMERFPDITFYDYTKLTSRKKAPANYHLTFSRGSSNEPAVEKALANGMNVAAVFKSVPITFYGRRVIDGDRHDLRFLDPKGVIVGLTPKGPARKSTSNFII